MRKHYIAMDEIATADEVLTAIAKVVAPGGQASGVRGEITEANGGPQAPSKAQQNGAKPQENAGSGGD
jgi:hypothetical protein